MGFWCCKVTYFDIAYYLNNLSFHIFSWLFIKKFEGKSEANTVGGGEILGKVPAPTQHQLGPPGGLANIC